MASCGSISVEPEFSASGVNVTSCPAPPTTVPPGEQFDVDVTVQNSNSVSASADVVVTADGSEIGSVDGAGVFANDSVTVTVTCTAPSQQGDYAIEANVAGASGAVNTNVAATPRLVEGIPTPDGIDTGTLLTAGAGLGALGLNAFAGRR